MEDEEGGRMRDIESGWQDEGREEVGEGKETFKIHQRHLASLNGNKLNIFNIVCYNTVSL